MTSAAGGPYDQTTALLVVDLQNDFVLRDGALHVPGAEQVLPLVDAEVRAAEAAGASVVYTQDWHPPETPHFTTGGGPWPVHCVAGTPGADLVDGLRLVASPPLRGEVVQLRKGTGTEDGYSAFSEVDLGSGERLTTGLESLLRGAGVRSLVVVGLAGDYCVRASAVDGAAAGFATTVVVAATRFVALAPGDDAAARESMAAAGVRLV